MSFGPAESGPVEFGPVEFGPREFGPPEFQPSRVPVPGPRASWRHHSLERLKSVKNWSLKNGALRALSELD